MRTKFLTKLVKYLKIWSNPMRRKGWDAAFAEMAKHQDDMLLDEENATEWEQEEWIW